VLLKLNKHKDHGQKGVKMILNVTDSIMEHLVLAIAILSLPRDLVFVLDNFLNK